MIKFKLTLDDIDTTALKKQLLAAAVNRVEEVGEYVAAQIKANTPGVDFGDEPIVRRLNEENGVIIEVNNPNTVKEINKQKTMGKVWPMVPGLLKTYGNL